MCLGDFRRRDVLKSTTRVITVPGTGGQLAPASADRVAIAFAATGASALWVRPDVQGAAGEGIGVHDAYPYHRTDALKEGDLATHAWFGFPQGGARACMVTEWFVAPLDWDKFAK